MAGTRTVVTPRGREWTVKRRWTVPGHRGTAGRPVGPPSRKLGLLGVGIGLDDMGLEHIGCLGVLIIGVLGLLGVVFGVVIVASLLVGLLIGVGVLVVGVVGAITRGVFGRPWLVEARSGHDALAWHVRGYGTAGIVVDQLADALQRGDESPHAHGAERVVLA